MDGLELLSHEVSGSEQVDGLELLSFKCKLMNFQGDIEEHKVGAIGFPYILQSRI